MYLFLTRCVTWALQKQEVPVWEKREKPLWIRNVGAINSYKYSMERMER